MASTVLNFYVCREVEGQWYLVSDFTSLCVRSCLPFEHSLCDTLDSCYDDKWHQFVPFNVVAIILYPVGIPLLFFGLLFL